MTASAVLLPPYSCDHRHLRLFSFYGMIFEEAEVIEEKGALALEIAFTPLQQHPSFRLP